MKNEVTFTVTVSGEPDTATVNNAGTSQKPPVKQSSEVVNFEGAPEPSFQTDEVLLADVL